MAGIELKEYSDKFLTGLGGSVAGNGGGSIAGDILGGAAMMAVPGAGWAGAAMQLVGAMFSGKSEQSGSAAQADGQLNTSGWVVGKGDANGGSLASSRGAAWPWYVWAALTLGAVVIIRKAA